MLIYQELTDSLISVRENGTRESIEQKDTDNWIKLNKLAINLAIE